MSEVGVDEIADRGSAADRVSFEAAYPVLVAAAHAAARRWGGSVMVDDVVAETLLRAWARWDRLAGHANVAGWSYRCAQNVCREFTRTQVRETLGTDTEPVVATGRFDDLFEDRSQVAVALTVLLTRQRRVVTLRYLCDLDEATTAQRLGLSVGNVRAAAHEARGRLRVLLEDPATDCAA